MEKILQCLGLQAVLISQSLKAETPDVCAQVTTMIIFDPFQVFLQMNVGTVLAVVVRVKRAMGQQRTEVTESLLFRQGHDNLVYSEENGGVGGVGDGGSVATSNVTTILALSTFVASCTAFGFGCAIGYSSPTQSSIMEDLGLSVAEFSLFGSILSIGAILGAAICGKKTDLLGRKLTMWVLNLFYISGWLAIAFTKVPWLLDLGRMSLGFTNGVSGYLVPIYIAEITPKNLRGRYTAMVPLMVCWGLSFMYVVGSFVNWRTLALVATIPSLLQLPLLFFIPESPRWLAKVGRNKELEAALLSLRGEKADISDEATEIKGYVEYLKRFSKGRLVDIFQRKYARPLLIVVGMLALSNLGGINAFAYYSGVIFVSAGIPSILGLITLAAAQTLSGILATILIDKSGRRPLLLAASAGLCFSSFLTGLSFFLKEYNLWDQATPILALIGLLMYMGSYVVTSGIPWLLISELFPINVKGSAGSICNFIGSITGWIVAYYFNILTQWSSAVSELLLETECAKVKSASLELARTHCQYEVVRMGAPLGQSFTMKLTGGGGNGIGKSTCSTFTITNFWGGVFKVKRAMGQQRTEITESLFVRQGHDNLVYSEENGGGGGGGGVEDGGSVAASNVTTILALSSFVAACPAFGYGCAVGYSSPTQSSIMEDLGLSVAETMWILNLFYISGWLAIAFTKVPWLLDLGRMSLGFTKGVSSYLAPIYIAEIAPKNLRGRFTAIVPLMTCWGISFMYVAGSFINWRTLALVATIPGLLQLPLLFFIPESPRWLVRLISDSVKFLQLKHIYMHVLCMYLYISLQAKFGRDKQLEAALLSLRGEKADISDEATDIKGYVESLESFSKGGLFDIFRKMYARPLIIVVGMMALLNLGGIDAFAYYSGVIFVSAGIPSNLGLITQAAVETFSGVLATIFIDKSGRRPLLLAALAGLCFSSFLTGLSFFLKEYNLWDQASPILALIGPVTYKGSYVVVSGILWLLISELFPINVKGSAGSICNIIGSITGWIVAYYFNILTQWSSAGDDAFFIYLLHIITLFYLSNDYEFWAFFQGYSLYF
ncbi:hypothetical protein DITRI_Ditri06bG0159800 [Diplodiscus trichospermus]